MAKKVEDALRHNQALNELFSNKVEELKNLERNIEKIRTELERIKAEIQREQAEYAQKYRERYKKNLAAAEIDIEHADEINIDFEQSIQSIDQLEGADLKILIEQQKNLMMGLQKIKAQKQCINDYLEKVTNNKQDFNSLLEQHVQQQEKENAEYQEKAKMLWARQKNYGAVAAQPLEETNKTNLKKVNSNPKRNDGNCCDKLCVIL